MNVLRRADESSLSHYKKLYGLRPPRGCSLLGDLILDEIKRYFTEATTISVTPTMGDIENYLKMKLAGDTMLKAMNGKLKAKIMREIPGNISQM